MKTRAIRAGAALLLATLLPASAAFAVTPEAGRLAPQNPPAPVIRKDSVQVESQVPPAVPFDAKAPPVAPAGKVVEVTLDAVLAKLELSPGQFQEVWTFGGSVPAPTIRVTQGDTVRITLNNKDPQMEHGLDFHFAQADSGTFHQAVKPGESITYEFKANYPGVFLYHCSAGPVIMHLANGMFGAVMVDPPGYKAEGKEYVLIQHEWYQNQTDLNELLKGTPTAMAFNGIPNQYLEKPLTANPGERVRFYFLDAGPNRFAAFHVIGTIFDKVYADGNPANALTGVQTVTVPPGGAVIADLYADTGTYPILTHAPNDASKGALGILKVGEPGAAHDPKAHGDGGAAAQPSAPPSHDHGSAAPAPQPAPAEGEMIIGMANFAFKPATIKVKAGTTVTWVNEEATEHTVVDANAATPAERLFDSTGEKDGKPRQYMQKGDRFSYTFTKPGTYKYKCLPHPFMTGTIIVE